VALVNCLNFGNPEHPEVMWQLSQSIDGMAEACRALAIPVIGGNVSLYNESGGTDIDPTPVVAVLGVIDALVRRPPGAVFVDGTALVLLGATDRALAGSRWATQCRGHRGGVLPALDLAAHRTLLGLVADLVADGDLVAAIHDVSDGGLGVALAECAVRSGLGCRVEGVDGHAELFSESPGRVIVGTTDPHEVLARAAAASVPARIIGHGGGPRLVIEGLVDVSVADATAAWREALPGALGQPPAA
jgi:phosphoribosylformylglycinamidine synthase